MKENFDPVIEKPVSTIEEIAPVVFEESKKHTEIRIDPIEESIYKSIKEATTVIFEESKPAEKEIAAIVADEPKIEEQHKEIASVVFEEVKITEEKPNEVIPTIPDQPTTVEESPKEVINFILEEPIFIEESKEVITDGIEESVIEKNTPKTQFEETLKIAEENLEIGKPLDFSVKEKHSFQEWLQLARPEPIDRTNEIVQEDIKAVEKNTQKVERAPEPIKLTVPETEIIEDEKKKKAELIDKFIETNPKISPIKSDPITLPPIQFNINQEDNSYLMTETLARVYLEQKKYTKAIQAYEILILKYPEKISFFADRISDIKILQQNNNNN
ncbi:tetratricopeptide repeat protein [Flavobacterium pectinovorum]|uniref:tetratricopeptide repeat protein n=1 Tax=Flavobacterium pectinovorum TaxID=29533 RepID=UPI003F678194